MIKNSCFSETISPLVLPSHQNPYPYYAQYRQSGNFYFDDDLACWVVSRAKVMQSIFASEHCVVRPPQELVPKKLIGSSAGEIFSYLVRMNEAGAHTKPKQILKTSLRKLDLSLVGKYTLSLSQQLEEKYSTNSGKGLNQWIVRLPVSVMASVLGFSDSEIDPVVDLIGDFVACLSPLCTDAQLQTASYAAQSLKNKFAHLLAQSQSRKDSFLFCLQEEAHSIGWGNTDAIIANLIGLLTQTYEATTGLIGNGIVVLNQHPNIRQKLCHQHIFSFIEEVARFDSPVQNTRRFVQQTCEISGQVLQEGDVILLLIAAANRDEEWQPDAEVFLWDRKTRSSFTFSNGRHACPGQEIAVRIAVCATNHLLNQFTQEQWQTISWRYRNSANGRIPQFAYKDCL